METYEELRNKVAGYITAYHDDLKKHDRDWIDSNPGVPFIHYTRSYGTHILPLPPAETYSCPTTWLTPQGRPSPVSR